MTDRGGGISEADRGRIRTTLRIAWIGGLVGVVLALVVGLLGGSGALGLAVLLLVTAVACSLAALHAVVSLVHDDLKDRQPARRRAVLAIGLFALAAVLMAMVAGVGG